MHPLKQIALISALMTALIAPNSLCAQTTSDATAKPAAPAAEKRFYRLEFTVKQIEGGRVINSRSYSMVLTGQQRTAMRSGTRVPYKQGTDSNYIDTGVNIDCASVIETEGQLSLHVKAELNSVAGSASNSPPELPALRHNLWDSDVIFPLRKATVLFSSDDFASKQNVQLEVLATPIK